jgi:tagatose-6-phosphate ketose/aldose isomerase
MNYLGLSQAELERAGGYWTAREISQQPAVWRAIEKLMAGEAAALHHFLDPLLKRPNLRIVLTGAGTSAFVGECLVPSLVQAGRHAQALATTDLVGSPHSWLASGPTLLVSFARSGNSPESVAALDLAQHATSECHHLIFTCNRDGALYKFAEQATNAHAVLLPEETNDRGFAMTSSFSGMVLAAALGFGLLPADAVSKLAAVALKMLNTATTEAKVLVESGFERVVYLGSNECKGLAREAALKMLELSDGRVVTMAETPLGFRHGPKTVVDAKTLVIIFLSNDAYTRGYELDVLKEISADGVAGRVIYLDAQQASSAGGHTIAVPDAQSFSNLSLCLPYVIFAQVLAFLQSHALGFKPDLPNTQGVVNRVVPGFTIYPWDTKR